MTKLFPEAESAAGWRHCLDDAQARDAGMDATRLRRVFELQDHLFGGETFSIAIARAGELVAEHHSFMAHGGSAYHVWSCTKSFTSIAWGIMLEEAPDGVSLDSAAYPLLGERARLSDPAKAGITLRHLLSMTSGIPGEDDGLYGFAVDAGENPFEHAFGHIDNRDGRSASKLSATPGEAWDYSDPAYAHLSPLFVAVTGRQLPDFLNERVFAPVGIESASWEMAGGDGNGPFATAQTGLHISARDLARFGLLLGRKGRWRGEQIVPESWISSATGPSQTMKPDYGLGFWNNAGGTRWPGLPRDTFAMEGHCTNRCYVVPSHDLVVARTAAGPTRWNEPDFISGVMASVL